ncbi:hypothetical protein SR41_16615 [Sphingomonas melonis]|uniref:Uncharacterized protein n=1 Tax=Sphingomonas melonis TaxID=152682 RepID=A0A0D1ME28_9SPHN|nr:hypothetical protein SR41_16615 [Sphingomonas melonis]
MRGGHRPARQQGSGPEVEDVDGVPFLRRSVEPAMRASASSWSQSPSGIDDTGVTETRWNGAGEGAAAVNVAAPKKRRWNGRM